MRLKVDKKRFLKKVNDDTGPSRMKIKHEGFLSPEINYLINGYKSQLFFLSNRFSNSFSYHLESLKSLSFSNSDNLRFIAYAWLLLYDITGDYSLSDKKKSTIIKELEKSDALHCNKYAKVPFFIYQQLIAKKNISKSPKKAILIGPGDIKENIDFKMKVDNFIIFNNKGPNSNFYKDYPLNYIYSNSLQFNDATKYKNICRNNPKLIAYPKKFTDFSYQDSKYTDSLFTKNIFLFGRPHQGIISLIHMLEMEYDEINTYGMSFFLNTKNSIYKKSNFADMNYRLSEHSLFQCYAIFLCLVKYKVIEPTLEHLNINNVGEYSKKLNL